MVERGKYPWDVLCVTLLKPEGISLHKNLPELIISSLGLQTG